MGLKVLNSYYVDIEDFRELIVYVITLLNESYHNTFRLKLKLL